MITVTVVYRLSFLCHLTRETLFWVLTHTHAKNNTHALSSAAPLLVKLGGEGGALIQSSAFISVQYWHEKLEKTSQI